MHHDSAMPELPVKAQTATRPVPRRPKQYAYFSVMPELDQKQKNGGEITMAINPKLGQLLAAHDDQVNAFNEATQHMKERNHEPAGDK